VGISTYCSYTLWNYSTIFPFWQQQEKSQQIKYQQLNKDTNLLAQTLAYTLQITNNKIFEL
jgi:hypothetical protein